MDLVNLLQVIAFTILRFRKLKGAHTDPKGKTLPSDLCGNSISPLLLEAWKPVSMGYKKRYYYLFKGLPTKDCSFVPLLDNKICPWEIWNSYVNLLNIKVGTYYSIVDILSQICIMHCQQLQSCMDPSLLIFFGTLWLSTSDSWLRVYYPCRFEAYLH